MAKSKFAWQFIVSGKRAIDRSILSLMARSFVDSWLGESVSEVVDAGDESVAGTDFDGSGCVGFGLDDQNMI
jgi:hypothetical protein